MWLPNPSVDDINRPRLAVAIISAVAAISAGYYAYQSNLSFSTDASAGVGLQRSNAVRRSGRPRRQRARAGGGSASSTTSETPGDENADVFSVPPPATGDGETVIDEGADEGADEWWNDNSNFPPTQRAGHNIVNLLFRVSEDNARRNGCVHRGCQCNACGMVPIRGVRYRCANCADFDLCETCEAQGVHIKTHIFYKIRVPAPPFGPRQMQSVWYTGDPDTCRRTLPRALIAKLSKETGFERPELEAFWEQWTFMANAEWREDPDELCVAMDRKTFERCLVPTGGSRHAAPNLIHDRMFSFYDSNHDGLIGFAEFLHGLAYRRQKDKLTKVFEGYDIDSDGFVDRRDFLRMFRAYYVLYKQMHKDILDGLEDQLLANTEAQQLVNSRQPLSSLFGREGRVPAADGNMRFEGKTYHPDGTVDVEDKYKHAVAENEDDTADREDILTSLFAYETDQRSRRRLITRNDSDTDWRTVRRLSGTRLDRSYWAALIDPPTTLEELPEIIMGHPSLQFEIVDDGSDEDEDGNEDNNDDNNEDNQNGERRRRRDSTTSHDSRPITESEARARAVSLNRRRAPKLEQRRKEMARDSLHDRWARREFYLDEEEGGNAPEDWGEDEDILARIHQMVDDAHAAAGKDPVTSRSRSNSGVRFANDVNDYEAGSRPSTPPRSMPDRTGSMLLPAAERDAGKEILYQVTQQAFNELLDTIFKPAEDLAVEAAKCKEERKKYSKEIAAVELPDEEKNDDKPPAQESAKQRGKSVADKSIEELLSETGYSIIPQEPREPRNAIEIDPAVDLSGDESLEDEDTSVESFDEEGREEEHEQHRDPTMPQFRPNSDAPVPPRVNGFPVHETAANPEPASLPPPSLDKLRYWKKLSLAEAEATERGGWGRLSFTEFEAIFKGQEHQGNRLDYLGSWIDFCIP